MGTSTDAILAFGFDLGEDVPENLLPDGDFDEFVKEQAGLTSPKHSNYESEEWKEHFAACRKAVEQFPVDLITHCSYEYPMYFLAVRGTEQKAWRGSPRSVDAPEMSGKQILELKRFCEKHEIEWQEPKWHIFSMWG